MPRRVTVTAGATGIGREIAHAFAADGAKVFVGDIDQEALDAFAEELPSLSTMACDVSKRQDVERMVAFGAKALGGVDVLLNNAGVSGPTAPVDEMNPDEFAKTLSIELGAFGIRANAILPAGSRLTTSRTRRCPFNRSRDGSIREISRLSLSFSPPTARNRSPVKHFRLTTTCDKRPDPLE